MKHLTLYAIGASLLLAIICTATLIVLVRNSDQNKGTLQPKPESPVSDIGDANTPELPTFPIASNAVEDIHGVVSKQSFTNTGVKTDMLLGVLNANTHPDVKYHHQFSLVRNENDVLLYQDSHSSIVLMLLGPPEDLLLIEMAIPMKDFIDEQANGELDLGGAAAFGRCVQRLGLAIDPTGQRISMRG